MSDDGWDGVRVDLDITYATENVSFQDVSEFDFDFNDQGVRVVEMRPAPPDDTDW